MAGANLHISILPSICKNLQVGPSLLRPLPCCLQGGDTDATQNPFHGVQRPLQSWQFLGQQQVQVIPHSSILCLQYCPAVTRCAGP